MARRAVAQDGQDDAETMSEVEPLFSPVCTWCSRWKPGDGRHCAQAYPKGVGGPQIPMDVWDGRNTHMRHISQPNDHGYTFALHPQANLAAMKRENRTLYDAYMARNKAASDSGHTLF